MKKYKSNSLICILFLFIISSCSEKQPSKGYILTGKLTGINKGKVTLIKFDQEDRTSTNIDSADFTEGAFTLEGQIDGPEMMSLIIEPGNWMIPVFMENSRIDIVADTANAAHVDYTAYGGDKSATIRNYTISGSQSQDGLYKYENDPGLKLYEPVLKRLTAARQEAGENHEQEDKIKQKIDSVGRLQSQLEKQWIDSFVTANPGSAAGAYLFNNYYLANDGMPLQDIESMVSKFTGNARASVYFDGLSQALSKRKALQPGNPAPDFTLLKPDSSSFTLSSLRGKYVMLDFWASWCVPCRKAIPHWKELYKKYQNKGFEIVAVTDDIQWDEWFKALEVEKMPWTQVADEFPVENRPARVGTLYMTPSLPFYVLLDKEGKILIHNATKQDIDEKLKELLGS